MAPGLALLLLTLALPAPAQDDVDASAPVDAPAETPEAGPRLPVKRWGPAAPYPPDALARGVEADVLLELDVDESGRVLDARVVEAVGMGFDEAALQAGRSFLFDPALDEQGQPVAARIQYRYRFTVTQAPPLSVEGRIVAEDDAPIPGAEVVLVGPGDERQVAVSDEQGAFRFAGLPAGAWLLGVSAPGRLAHTSELEVVEGQAKELSVILVSDRPADFGQEVGEVVEIRGERTQPEVSERVLPMEQVRYLPGTGGDVVKAVQNLPGVARAPSGIAQLIIRGTAPEDSSFYLDGMPLPLVFHFAGLNTVVNSDSLEEVAYLPGNYGVRYGRTLGGLVDLRTNASLPDESRGKISVDLFQATAFVEQKVGDQTALTFSGRRSYVDTLLSPLLSKLTGNDFQAPRYYDLNARVLHRSDRADVFDAFLVASSDAFRIYSEDEQTGEEEISIGLQTRFAKLRLLYRHVGPTGWRQEATFIAGAEEQAFQIAPDGDAFERPLDVAGRYELFRAPQGDLSLGLRTGLDLQASMYRFAYDVPSFGVREEGDIGILAPAAYVEPTVRLGRVDLVPGLRTDLYVTDAGYEELALDPRMAVRWKPAERTLLKLSVGKHSQFPEPREVTPSSDGSLDLTHEWSLQTGIGWEQRFGERWSLELGRYYNWLFDLVSGNEDAFRFFSGPPPFGPLDTEPYANDGTGRVASVELLVKYEADKTLAWLSGTVGRSVRQKRPDSAEVLFQYDQPFNLYLLASQELPKRWRLGGRLRFGAGNPYTPLASRYLDLDSGEWQPIYADEQGRTPPFFQLDLRMDKRWEFRKWDLSFYLDLQNATNMQNVEIIGYSDDYSVEEPITGLPLVPAFGLEGEW